MIRQLRLAATAAALSAAVLSACGDDGITLPDERAATAISINGGGNQTGTVGAPLPQPVQALVSDAQGRPVVDQRVEFTVTGGGTVTPAAVQTNGTGHAATQWVLGTAAGTQSLTARPMGNGAANVSATAQATATAGPAARIDAVSGSPQSAVAGTTLPNPLVAGVVDEFGNGVAGVQIEWSVTGGGSVSEPTTLTDAQGRASVTRTLGTSPGAQETQAAVAGLEGSPVAFSATASVGTAGRLSITRAPSSTAQSGVAFATQPQIQLRDASNNPVPQGGVAILAELASGPSGASLRGTNIAATNSSGLATFTSLGITGPAGEYTINFSGSESSLTGVTSGTITIAAGAATGLRFASQPASTVAGATLSAVRVELVDAQGNVVTDQSRTVTLQLQGGAGTLSGTTSVATISGVATFSNLSVSQAGSYRLAASASGLAGAQSDPFSVSPGAAAALEFITQPTAVDAGAAISPAVRVEVQDAGGNRVSSYSGLVTIAIATNPSTGTLSGTLGVNAVAGIATFTDLAINRAGTGYTLRATAAGLDAATSTAFTVRAGTGSSIEKIAGDEQSALVGQVVATDPKVRVTDASNNPVSGVAVTFAVASGGGSVTGGTQTTNSNGEATVGSWRLGSTAGPNTLTASATGIGSVIFTATGTAGSGSGLEFDVAPQSSIASGAIFSAAPVVQIIDAQGNPVGTAGVPITISISGAASLSGDLTRNTDATGKVGFGSIAVSGPVGSYTLSFSGQGTPLTAPISITPGGASAAQSTLQLSPASVAPSNSTTVTVTVKDAQGNSIAGAGVSLSSGGAAGSFGETSLTTGSDGTASTTYTPAATGTHTIAATITSSGAPITESADLDVQASGTTTSIIGHTPDPSTRGEAVAVSFAVTSAGGAPVGAVTVSADEGASCSATTAAGSCTLTFTRAGNWSITAAYEGGGAFAPSSGNAAHQVNRVQPQVSVAEFVGSPTVGQPVTVQFSLTSPFDFPEGQVSVTTTGPDGASTAGPSCSGDIAAGSCSLEFVIPGTWIVTASYAGDADFYGDIFTTSLAVAAP